MAISLSHLQKDERTCIVEFDGETAEVTYKPSAYTPETEDAYQREIDARRPSGGCADILASMVTSWQVVDDDGEEIPIDKATLRQMPSSFLFSVMAAIVSDLNTERDDRKNSAGGSPRKASRGKSLSGTR